MLQFAPYCVYIVFMTFKDKPDNQLLLIQQFKQALDGLSTLAEANAVVTRTASEKWHQLEIEFGGQAFNIYINGIQLIVKLKFGLISKGEIECQVSVRLEDHEQRIAVNSKDFPGLEEFLQPTLPPAYEAFLKQNVSQQLADGFKSSYLFATIDEENPLIEFWSQVIIQIAQQIKVAIVDVDHELAGNPLMPLSNEIMTLALAQSIVSVMSNYFLNRNGVGEAGFRNAYAQSMRDDPTAVDPEQLYPIMDVVYIHAARRFRRQTREYEFKTAHDELILNPYLSFTQLGILYKEFLRKIGHDISVPKHEITFPNVNQTMILNYNPAMVKALADYMWRWLDSKNVAEDVTKEQKAQFVYEMIMGFLESIAYQNVLLTDQNSDPVALNDKQLRATLGVGLSQYLQEFK